MLEGKISNSLGLIRKEVEGALNFAAP